MRGTKQKEPNPFDKDQEFPTFYEYPEKAGIFDIDNIIKIFWQNAYYLLCMLPGTPRFFQ